MAEEQPVTHCQLVGDAGFVGFDLSFLGLVRRVLLLVRMSADGCGITDGWSKRSEASISPASRIVVRATPEYTFSVCCTFDRSVRSLTYSPTSILVILVMTIIAGMVSSCANPKESSPVFSGVSNESHYPGRMWSGLRPPEVWRPEATWLAGNPRRRLAIGNRKYALQVWAESGTN